MSLRSLILEHLLPEPGRDPVVIAKLVVAEADTGDLVELVAEEVRHEQRLLVRLAEREVFGGVVGRSGGAATSLPSALLKETFKLGNGTVVEWGRATIDQHQQRIIFLEKLRDGLQATINRHATAITLITEAGVSCLDELEGEAA